MKDQLIFVDRLSLQVFKMFKKWRYAVIIRALMGAHGIEGETPNLRFSHLAILTGQTDSKNLLSLPLPRCLCGKNVSSGILKDRCMSRVCACADCARHAFQIPRPALSQPGRAVTWYSHVTFNRSPFLSKVEPIQNLSANNSPREFFCNKKS